MAHLKQRRILLAVCGGIAAYKSAELVRQLQTAGATVRVLMTRAAQEFITPLTLQALSGHAVHSELLDAEAERGMGHIELARWADLLLIAPATADCLARLASGRADDLLTAVALATSAPVLLAPAMNQQMWAKAATQENLSLLEARGALRVGPESGTQACGEIGPGRMSEPVSIAAAAAELFSNGRLSGRHVVITAGPTREALDPVRFISNHSSGRMGFAVAEAAADAGAAVTLIAGPVQLETPAKVERIDVVSAAQMHEASLAALATCDIFIASAAVADYRPVSVAEQKIKKSGDRVVLEMARNPDIVAAVAGSDAAPFTVGFAAETERLREHALGKMQRKGLAMIVANQVGGETGGFNTDDNAALLLWPGGEREIALCSKKTLARVIIEQVATLYGDSANKRSL